MKVETNSGEWHEKLKGITPQVKPVGYTMEVEDNKIKWLVELSPTEEEADSVIAEFRPNFSYRQKCDLLLRHG